MADPHGYDIKIFLYNNKYFSYFVFIFHTTINMNTNTQSNSQVVNAHGKWLMHTGLPMCINHNGSIFPQSRFFRLVVNVIQQINE